MEEKQQLKEFIERLKIRDYEKSTLNETLTSYSPDKFAGFVKRFYKFPVQYAIKEKTAYVIIHNISPAKIIGFIHWVFRSQGWFCAAQEISFPSVKIKNDNEALGYINVDTEKLVNKYDPDELTNSLTKNSNCIIKLKFEPKFGVQLSDFEIPDTVYHITEKKNIPRILKQGLTPRTTSKLFTHPERVYFSFDELGAKNIIILPGFAKPRIPYCILKVKVKDLVSNGKMKLYWDTNLADACYTLNSIPPSAILDKNNIEDIPNPIY